MIESEKKMVELEQNLKEANCYKDLKRSNELGLSKTPAYNYKKKEQIFHNMQYSPYMYEQMACFMRRNLQISSSCNAKCLFCSNNQNPFSVKRLPFRSIHEIKHALCHIDYPSSDGEYIALNDALPGRISEGEAFLHPDLFEILKMIRSKYSGILQITTNGTHLTPQMLDQLSNYKPMKFSISYHSHNSKHWSKIFGLDEEQYETVKNSFPEIKERGFILEAIMVPLPKLVGWDDINKTFEYTKRFTNDFYVYCPGYTKYTRPEIVHLLDTDNIELSTNIKRIAKKYSIAIRNPTDPQVPLNFYPYFIMERTVAQGYKDVGWLVSEAAYPRIREIISRHSEYFNNKHYVLLVKNDTYQGNINCAGLLQVSDFRKALSGFNRKLDITYLPRAPFNRYGEDLMGETYHILEREFNTKIETM